MLVDVLCISDQPISRMSGMQRSFKMKGDKTNEPDACLGASLSKTHNETNKECCWAMSSGKHCAAADANATEVLNKKGLGCLKIALPLCQVIINK